MTLTLRRFVVLNFSRDTKLLMAVSGIFAVSFLGIQNLLKILYILRLGYGLQYIGLFSAMGALAYMAMSLPSGVLGTRFGARAAMLAGGVITVIGMAILPLTEFVPLWAKDSWPLITQAVLSVGWSLYNVNLVPALMNVTTPQNRNEGFALTSVARGLGTFAGTLSGGLLPGLFAYSLGLALDAPEPYRIALWVGALLGVIAIVPLARIGQVEQVVIGEPRKSKGPFPILPVALLVLHVYLSQGAWALCQTFCNPYMDTDLHLSAASIGLIVSVGQFIAILAPLCAPTLARRYSNGWTLMITTLGVGVSLIPLVLAPHWLAVGLGLLGMQILTAIWMPAFQVFQMEMVESHWRSLAYGIVSMAMGFTYASVSFGGGYMADAWGYRSLFLLGVGVSVMGTILMWGMERRPKVLVNSVMPVAEG